MTIIELKAKLETIGVPIAYRVFKENVKLPFIVFYQDDTDITASDGGIKYKQDCDYVVELYTDDKAIELERKLENLLCYDLTKNETYIEEDKMYMIKYEFSEVKKWQEME